jgi:hypothetical protein
MGNSCPWEKATGEDKLKKKIPGGAILERKKEQVVLEGRGAGAPFSRGAFLGIPLELEFSN